MLAKVKSYALDGLQGYAIDTEVDINSGLPGYELVGLASTATKESKERVRSAMKNSGLLYPMKRVAQPLPRNSGRNIRLHDGYTTTHHRNTSLRKEVRWSYALCRHHHPGTYEHTLGGGISHQRGLTGIGRIATHGWRD